MVSINCAAIPNELLESELFGYEEGAHRSKKGGKKENSSWQAAERFFLDEIGDMPLGMQAKLLLRAAGKGDCKNMSCKKDNFIRL